MKTPEELAEEYLRFENESIYWAKHAFLAGYKAAAEQYEAKIASLRERLADITWEQENDENT